MNEVDVVNAVLAGRTERFETLVTRYVGLARGICASYVRDDASHDDLVQESFVYAYTKLGTLRDRNRFGPWLCSIVRNTCRNWLRKTGRSAQFERALAAEPTGTPLTPDDLLTAKELREWVSRHIATLPESTREAMALCYLEGFAQKDAAEFLNISQSALKKRLQYGRDRIGERVWRTLDEDDDRKRNDAKLVGAIMAGVLSAQAPVAAASGLVAMAGVLASKPMMLSIAAGALVVIGAMVYRPVNDRSTELQASTPQHDTVADATDAIQVADARIVVQEPDPTFPTLSEPLNGTNASPIEPERIGISGVVILESTGTPIPDVEVELLTYTEREGLKPSDAYATNTDGTFAFPDVDRESEFFLRLGWPHQYAAKPFSRSFGRGPQPEHYVLEAQTVGAITGYVRDPNGKPVQSAAIRRSYPFGHQVTEVTRTGNDGRFGFSHDGGIWRLQAVGRMGLESELAVFDLPQGEIVEQDFVLAVSADIHLNVTTPTGGPAPNIDRLEVNRTLPELLPSGVPTTTTTYSGDTMLERAGNQLSLRLIPEGSYTIELKAAGFMPVTVGPVVIGAELEDQYVDVTFELDSPEKTVTAMADDDSGVLEELVEVRVHVQDQYGNALDTLGTFTYAVNQWGELHDDYYSLTPGPYWLAAVKEGYGAELQYRAVNAESNEITFTLGDGGTIFGTASVPRERKLAVYPLELWESFGSPPGNNAMNSNLRALGNALTQGTQIDDDNAFVLPPLSEGWYVVMTNTSVSAPVEVRPGHTTGPIALASSPEATAQEVSEER